MYSLGFACSNLSIDMVAHKRFSGKQYQMVQVRGRYGVGEEAQEAIVRSFSR
jgi:hypothetical protein